MAPPIAAATTDLLEAPIDDQVEFELLDMVLRGLPEGFASGAVPLAVSAALLQMLAAPPQLVPWVVGVAAVLTLGTAAGLVYRRRPPLPQRMRSWRRAAFLLAGASGLSWGMAGWLFLPAPWQAELVLLALLLSLAAAVLANIGACLPMYLCFVTAAMLPTSLQLARLGGVMNLGMAAGALLMIPVLALYASRLATATRRSLRVGQENRRLAQALALRTQQAEQASLDKSRFIAAASHDLRQPVHALGLLLDVLQGQRLGPQAQATAARMSHVLDSLDALFEALLDISKLDSSAIEARPADFALGPLLGALAEEFAAEAQAKGLVLRCRDSTAWVRSDPLLLQRMLRNLLANAVRYTDRGGILVGARRRGDRLHIEVWDTGVGIPAEQRDAVFDEFYQVAHPLRERDQGLGLGLAIVRRLGALLAHPVELQSRAGRGSVFRLVVPSVIAPAGQGAAPDDAGAMAAPTAVEPGRRVLVVDDDPHVRDSLVQWLESRGCRVTACADAAAARAAVDAMPAPPQALITDWRLTGPEDGLALARWMRRHIGTALPVILVTGDALDDARRLAQDQHMVLLHKPVRPAALRAALAAQWRASPAAAVEAA